MCNQHRFFAIKGTPGFLISRSRINLTQTPSPYCVCGLTTSPCPAHSCDSSTICIFAGCDTIFAASGYSAGTTGAFGCRRAGKRRKLLGEFCVSQLGTVMGCRAESATDVPAPYPFGAGAKICSGQIFLPPATILYLFYID